MRCNAIYCIYIVLCPLPTAFSVQGRYSSLQILQTIDTPRKERLERPPLCPTDHYALMLRCWSHNPEDRPKFAAVTTELTSIKPTLMKAIKSSSPAPGVMNFSEGDSIIVIDKQ